MIKKNASFTRLVEVKCYFELSRHRGMTVNHPKAESDLIEIGFCSANLAQYCTLNMVYDAYF